MQLTWGNVNALAIRTLNNPCFEGDSIKFMVDPDSVLQHDVELSMALQHYYLVHNTRRVLKFHSTSIIQHTEAMERHFGNV